jgi:hypothetical protein
MVEIPSLKIPEKSPTSEFELIDRDFLVFHTGSSQLESITDLEIVVNSEEQSLHVLSEELPRLESLKLNGSRLPSLRDLGIGTNWRNCMRILNITNCEVQDISGISMFPRLEELYAPFNSIKCITPLIDLDFLIILDLEGNLIKDFSHLRFLNQLVSLSAAGNPYKLSAPEIVKFLPRIETFNDAPVAELRTEDTENDLDNELRDLIAKIRRPKADVNLSTRGSASTRVSTSRPSTAPQVGSASALTSKVFQGGPLDAIRFKRSRILEN